MQSESKIVTYVFKSLAVDWLGCVLNFLPVSAWRLWSSTSISGLLRPTQWRRGSEESSSMFCLDYWSCADRTIIRTDADGKLTGEPTHYKLDHTIVSKIQSHRPRHFLLEKPQERALIFLSFFSYFCFLDRESIVTEQKKKTTISRFCRNFTFWSPRSPKKWIIKNVRLSVCLSFCLSS